MKKKSSGRLCSKVGFFYVGAFLTVTLFMTLVAGLVVFRVVQVEMEGSGLGMYSVGILAITFFACFGPYCVFELDEQRTALLNSSPKPRPFFYLVAGAIYIALLALGVVIVAVLGDYYFHLPISVLFPIPVALLALTVVLPLALLRLVARRVARDGQPSQGQATPPILEVEKRGRP